MFSRPPPLSLLSANRRTSANEALCDRSRSPCCCPRSPRRIGGRKIQRECEFVTGPTPTAADGLYSSRYPHYAYKVIVVRLCGTANRLPTVSTGGQTRSSSSRLNHSFIRKNAGSLFCLALPRHVQEWRRIGWLICHRLPRISKQSRHAADRFRRETPILLSGGRPAARHANISAPSMHFPAADLDPVHTDCSLCQEF